MIRFFLVLLLSASLCACQTMTPLEQRSELAYGKQLFEAGYYKRALHELLPVACNHNAEAEYAVGYLYYYGYGVAQDTDVGYFWIKRAADQDYLPAKEALKMIQADSKFRKPPHDQDKLRTM